uniref:NPC1 like intracellular cholesterol transporter 1 n=1 Tax=Sinocyclocheilus anshuiensis TaxID=1608454 RepID=A0A671PPZ1_9TELE
MSYFCLLKVLASAQYEPGYCSFYEDCGLNPAVEGALIPPRVPCKDYRKVVNVTGDHYELLKSVCPMLAHGEGETLACCSIRQLTALQSSLTLSKAVLIRCPSCADNFAHIHCATTCSPNQSQILKITKTANITQPTGIVKEAVVGYEAYISMNFSDASFRSCKNIRIPATGGYAIATMCGRYGSTLCTPQRWLDFQGDSSNGLAPLDINFKLLSDGQTAGLPPGAVLFDCEQSCPAVPQPPPLPKPFMIGRLDGVLVISIIIFSCIFFLIMCYVILECTVHIRKSKGTQKSISNKDQNENEIEHKISSKDVTCSDKASLATQEFLGSLFLAWGTIMARYPLIVLPVCLVVVLAFAVGIKDIELTTDPVQLWSAPESHAMREKAFHDAHFDPFYRTNQLILTAPHRPSPATAMTPYSLASRTSVASFLKVTLTQNKLIMKNELNRTARLKDVCYTPLNPGNPSLTYCAVNTVLPKYSPLSFKDIPALGMSCMADYGGPVFPFLAVGGYENEEYTTAEALILTFSLNNYTRTDVKFNVVEEWERKFLKIVQEYQENPNTNFTFAYMAERSLEDEINRTTAEDIPIFMISYAVIFLYISRGSWGIFILQVDSKFLVGLGGILVVGCSVMASMGFYACIGVPSSLVILQVVPFLVLAVGADNIFIFVLEYQVFVPFSNPFSRSPASRSKMTKEFLYFSYLKLDSSVVTSCTKTGGNENLRFSRPIWLGTILSFRRNNQGTLLPYHGCSSVTYVYYEHYLTIVNEGLFNIAVCLLPTFVVCCILLGMDLRSGFLNLLTIVMITVDTVGVMTLWGIDFNAVSLINLVTAVGISVEFVSHLTRSFALSIRPTKVERAKEATANMGSAVFAGVAMTNLPGIVVLALAKAQLIQIFFFRLNLVITLLGMAHGLIFLPVLLSFLGILCLHTICVCTVYLLCILYINTHIHAYIKEKYVTFI